MNYFIKNFELLTAFSITFISLWLFDMTMKELMVEYALIYIGLKLIHIQTLIEVNNK